MSAIRTCILVAALSAVALAQSPSQLCLQNVPRNFLADSSDCHYYYQCQVTNATNAIASRQKCSAGQFWHDAVLSCLPEGDVPCTDRCMSEPNTAARGCYAGVGCRQYYTCANTGSYGMCCPQGSVFVEATCSCEESETCTDACVQRGPAVATTVAPSSQVNATVCRDSYSSLISIVSGETNAYILLTEEGWATEKLYCVAGTAFNIASCRCDIEDAGSIPNPTTPLRKATIFMSFDVNTKDSSPHKYSTFLINGADRDTTTAAHGAGSLALNGGYLSVPGLKSFDHRDKASWCGFFRGNGAGALVSNAHGSQYTAVFGTSSSTSFSGKLNFWHPVGGQTIQSTFTPAGNGWNHFCVTYDGNSMITYLNGQVKNTQNVAGYLSISYNSYMFGYDANMGGFSGNLDELLVTPFAMTQQEVEYHRAGDYNTLQTLGFF